MRILDEWPVEKTVFLTLDLECDYGTALETNSFHAARQTGKLAQFLEAFDVPLSCFVQTELFERAPQALQSLQTAEVPVEFHPHSHTHPSHNEADIEFEVSESVDNVRDHFSTSPLGFRFPDGAIDPGDYPILADNDVAFSTSIFPSFRPGRFNNLQQPRHPFRHSPTGIIELPFTVYPDYLRIPVALSYLKVFGGPFRRLIHQQPPSTIVFDFHMHDLNVPPAFDDLPWRYKAVYSRHKNEGYRILADFVEQLHDRGYKFAQMTDLYEAVRDVIDEQ